MSHPQVVVIGAGLSGLAAAHRVWELDPRIEVTVLDGAARAGGVVRTERVDGFVVEQGPDSILTEKPEALALAKRLSLESSVIGIEKQPGGVYVVQSGRLLRVPEGFALLGPVRIWPFLTTPVLSPAGKARAALELVLPRGPVVSDESLESFVVRRYGRELFERLAQPLVGGIYGTEPARLSMRATVPRFLDLERDARSVSWGLWKKQRKAPSAMPSGARYGLFASFREGMQTLTDALAEKLSSRLRLGVRAHAIEQRSGSSSWEVALESGDRLAARAVIVAAPAWQASKLLRSVDATLSDQLGAIPYGSSATASLAYARDDVPHPLDAFGFIVPAVENRPIVASTWSSIKWACRAPEGKVLLRVFFGGQGGEPSEAQSEDDLLTVARAELAALMGITAPPMRTWVSRHHQTMPYYRVGHLDRVSEIEARASTWPGLALAGSAYRGVGVSDVVKSGERAADEVIRSLGS